MTQKRVFEFTGTTAGKDKVLFVEHFFVIGENAEEAMEKVQRGDPKVTDFECTGRSTACNKDW